VAAVGEGLSASARAVHDRGCEKNLHNDRGSCNRKPKWLVRLAEGRLTPDKNVAGGRVVDPSQSIDRIADVAFTDGKVAAVGEGLSKNLHNDRGSCNRKPKWLVRLAEGRLTPDKNVK
jgi:hypothetical protein